MNQELVLSRIERGVLRLQINVPERRNALSRPVLAKLTEKIVLADESVLGIVLTGGADIFSAGADFHELTGTVQDLSYDDTVSKLTNAIMDSPKIIVAAIEGGCLGAAADIALTCDLRIGAMSSYVQIPAIRLGLLYNPTAIDRLRRVYALDSVRRLLLFGEKFDAHAALRVGFLSRLCPDGKASHWAIERLNRIERSTLKAVAATKRLLGEVDPDAGRTEYWQECRRRLLSSDARQHAIAQAQSKYVKKK